MKIARSPAGMRKYRAQRLGADSVWIFPHKAQRKKSWIPRDMTDTVKRDDGVTSDGDKNRSADEGLGLS